MNDPERKKTKRLGTIIGVAVVVALAAVGLALALIPGRPRVTLTLVEYRRWPAGATLRLTNESKRTIEYFTEPNGVPMGSPLLRMEQTTSGGWTNRSLGIRTGSIFDPRTGKTEDFFFAADPTGATRAWSSHFSVLSRELKPGRSIDLFVGLEPGATPKRFGVVYHAPRGKLATKLRPLISRIRQWFRTGPATSSMAESAPGIVEVWCTNSIAVSAKQEPVVTKDR
jgi:hypothetical protein